MHVKALVCTFLCLLSTCDWMVCRTTDEMAVWLGGQEIMSRPQITSFFWEYIKTKNLLVGSLGSHPALLLLYVRLVWWKMPKANALHLCLWQCVGGFLAVVSRTTLLASTYRALGNHVACNMRHCLTPTASTLLDNPHCTVSCETSYSPHLSTACWSQSFHLL